MHYLFSYSTKSYGSHEHDPYDSESHRGSKRSLHNAEEKKDPSKEDVEIDPHGVWDFRLWYQAITIIDLSNTWYDF
jgi:hypothetical protein